MKPRYWVTPVVAIVLTSFIARAGDLAAQQKPPVFRAGVDLRQLDVTVQDRNRHPVLGLTAADFRIEEDGQVQAIEAFSFVDVPDTVTTEPAWARTAPSDVVSNDRDSARVFALLVDDVGGMGDVWANREMKKSVATFVGELGPEDIAAVVFPASGALSQNFTRDKARLINAVAWYGTRNNTLSFVPGMCEAGRRMPSAMLYVAENMATMKNRRKAIVYFGGALAWHTSSDICLIGLLWQQVIQVCKENNISIYPVDTMGLRPRPGRREDQYLSLAGETGGHAVLFSNSFDEGLKRIFAENSSYYLLAYQPTNTVDDGRFRRVVVSVNRADVEVTSTRNYWTPKAADAKRPAPVAAAPEVAALAGVLPMSQMPLRATAAAFKAAAEGSESAVVTLALGLAQPAFVERTRETVDVLIREFTPDGIDYGSERQLIAVTVPAAEGRDTSRYEVLARIEVPKPGRYELRVSAYSAATDQRGSVYVDVEVPDFARARLSLSGVMLGNAVSRVPVAPPGLLGDIVPVPPTTERAFAAADVVTAHMRVYQGGSDHVAPVQVRSQILDAQGKAVLDRVETLGADRFDNGRSADYQMRLPLNTLPAGDYLLTIDASVGKTAVRRTVRFSRTEGLHPGLRLN